MGEGGGGGGKTGMLHGTTLLFFSLFKERLV